MAKSFAQEEPPCSMQAAGGAGADVVMFSAAAAVSPAPGDAVAIATRQVRFVTKAFMAGSTPPPRRKAARPSAKTRRSYPPCPAFLPARSALPLERVRRVLRRSSPELRRVNPA